MIGRIEEFGAPVCLPGIAHEAVDRGQLDYRCDTGKALRDRANYAAMGYHDRIAGAAVMGLIDYGEHPGNAAMDAIKKSRAALALGISIVRIEAVAIPIDKVSRIALADFVSREAFERTEINFDKFFYKDRLGTGDNSGAFMRAA